jgi:hypothetical protein
VDLHRSIDEGEAVFRGDVLRDGRDAADIGAVVPEIGAR